MKIVCKNCGGTYDSKLSKCPYCNTMNKKGAYRDFRGKVSDMIDQMFGLKFETYDSRKKVVFAALIRGLITIVICIGIGAFFGLMSNVNYYNDKEYDEQTLEDIKWEDENLDKLEKAYAENDLETVKKILSQNYRFAYSWEHYTAYVLKGEYKDIMEEQSMNEYIFRDVLYFIFYPDYYANTNKMSKDERQDYLNDKQTVIEKMKGFGYSEEELKHIYDSCKDEYGYISSGDIRKFMKEADNG